MRRVKGGRVVFFYHLFIHGGIFLRVKRDSFVKAKDEQD